MFNIKTFSKLERTIDPPSIKASVEHLSSLVKAYKARLELTRAPRLALTLLMLIDGSKLNF
jgi:hypothetical protein